MLVRKKDRTLMLSINMHGAGDENPYCEVEADILPTIGPVISFYRFRTLVAEDYESGEEQIKQERYCALSLTYNGALGLHRFLPPLLNEAKRLSHRR